MRKRMAFRIFSTPDIFKRLLANFRNKENARRICPRCHSASIIGHGRYRERRRYKCKQCKRTFNDLTYTPFHYTHFPTKFVEFLLCIIRGYSLCTSAVQAGIHYVTAFYWRHKIIRALQQLDVRSQRYAEENLRSRWTSPYITFRDTSPIRLADFTREEEFQFQQWMSFRHWIKVKYLSRYIAWYRYTRSLPYIVKYDHIEKLFLLLCSFPLKQTYQSIKHALLC